MRPDHDKDDVKIVVFSYLDLEDILIIDKKQNKTGLVLTTWTE